MRDPAPQASPLLVGAALLAGGYLLRNWQPKALTLPDRPEITHNDSGVEKAARVSRDAIAKVLPSNLTGSVGRTLLIMGAGLVLVRLLDMAAEDEAGIF